MGMSSCDPDELAAYAADGLEMLGRLQDRAVDAARALGDLDRAGSAADAGEHLPAADADLEAEVLDVVAAWRRLDEFAGEVAGGFYALYPDAGRSTYGRVLSAGDGDLRARGIGPADLDSAGPLALGDVPGMPVTRLDALNRGWLATERHRLEMQLDVLRGLDGDHDREIARVESRLAGLAAVTERLETTPGGRPAYLLGLDTAGPGRAIVAVGDPETADNVVTYVPGTGTSLDSALGDDLERVDAVAKDAQRFSATAETSVVLWLGYDTPPDLASAALPSYAAAGARPLRDFQDRLHNAHDRGGARHTILGHSYGTTTMGHAARDPGLRADNLVFVGSPGVGADHVDDLEVDPDHVYATAAFHDPVGYLDTPSGADLAPPGSPMDLGEGIHDALQVAADHGPAPHRNSFGATEFPSDPGPVGFDAHSGYWDDGNQARENMAAIATGQHDLVERGRETPGWYDTVNVAGHADAAHDWATDRGHDAAELAVDAAEAAQEWAGDQLDDLHDGLSRPWG